MKLRQIKEFDIIIVNDGLTSLQSMIDCHPSLNVSIKDYKGTISENRIYGLNLAKQKEYKYVILADSDDFFSANRVQKRKIFYPSMRLLPMSLIWLI